MLEVDHSLRHEHTNVTQDTVAPIVKCVTLVLSLIFIFQITTVTRIFHDSKEHN